MKPTTKRSERWSPPFDIALVPDRRACSGLTVAAWVAVIAGGVLLVTLHGIGYWRFPLAMAWFFGEGAAVRHWYRGVHGLRAISFDVDGGVQLDYAGRQPAAVLLDGSLVGRRHAWLCLRTDSGRPLAVPLRAADNAMAWRRLMCLREAAR